MHGALILLAERVGFEPTVPCSTPDFESDEMQYSTTLVNTRFSRNLLFYLVSIKNECDLVLTRMVEFGYMVATQKSV